MGDENRWPQQEGSEPEDEEMVHTEAYVGPQIAINPGITVPIASSSTEITPASDRRIKVMMYNASDAPIGIRYASGGAAVDNVAYYIPAGGYREEVEWKGPLCGVHAVAGQQKNLAIGII